MSPAELEALLTKRDIRPTRQRLGVLGELAREPNDATATEIWRRMRRRKRQTIGLATVYRTLALLNERGVVDSLSHHPGERCFRLCGDAHHHHLVCEKCHRVVELDECDLGSWVDEAAGRHGFTASGHQVEITGLCVECRAAARP
jgi:Fur family transcriptional regulator, ferric uptake regulator